VKWLALSENAVYPLKWPDKNSGYPKNTKKNTVRIRGAHRGPHSPNGSISWGNDDSENRISQYLVAITQ
jgi:hypothetical protein